MAFGRRLGRSAARRLGAASRATRARRGQELKEDGTKGVEAILGGPTLRRHAQTSERKTSPLTIDSSIGLSWNPLLVPLREFLFSLVGKTSLVAPTFFGPSTQEVSCQEWAKIPADVDVLLTHTPPAQRLDLASYEKRIGSAGRSLSPKK